MRTLRIIAALAITATLGFGAVLAERTLGPLDPAMELNLLLVGVVLVAPVLLPFLD